MKRLLLLIFILGLVMSMVSAQDEAPRGILKITAVGETVESPEDGATAAAIWLHPTDLAQSVIIGSDDNVGIGVYGLDGALLQFISEGGAIAGVDLRYNFRLAGRDIVLIGGGVKDEPRINLYTIDAETRLLEQLGTIDTGMRLAALCMHVSRLTRTFYVIGISERGELEQYAVEDEDGEIVTKLARKIEVGGEVEACVADDSLGRLYISEGDSLVWRYGAEPEDDIKRSIVDIVGGGISEEVEGMTLYTAANNQGYLIITNEKSDSFLVYERTGDNELVGEFKIIGSEAIDAVTEPTGLAVVNLPLNDQYPQGLFVTTDDVNSNPNADNNFKLVSWADVAAGLGLEVDTTYDPRAVGVNSRDAVVDASVVTVTSKLETEPVPSGTDAADDPAIWIHPTDTALSTIIGTDKRNGLAVYNLDGSLLQAVNIGRLNNVDLRYNVSLGGESAAIVGATNRTFNTLVLFKVNPETRELEDVAAREIVSNVEEVYGFCMYYSPISGKVYAFINSADTGEVEQYELFDDGTGKLDAKVVRTFKLETQTEGCVADDENAVIYIGEEARGFWKFNAEPDAVTEGILIDSTGAGGNLTADTEGIALYYGANGTGYIIVSSQGSSEFVVYDRQGDNAYLGTFRIVENDLVDAVSGTDGLDVTNFPLGDAFPKGVVVVQDDRNINPDASQNFKLVAWEDIAAVLGLTVDTTFDPRLVGVK